MGPRVAAESLYKGLRRQNLMECDWRLFYPSGRVADDEMASSMLRRVTRAAAKNRQQLQHPVNPEAVQSRLLNDDDRKGLPRPRERLLLELRKA